MQIPRVEFLEGADANRRSLAPISVYCPLAGQMDVRQAGSGRARVRSGDVLILRGGPDVEIWPLVRRIEALVWTADASWASAVLSGFGGDEIMRGWGPGLFLEPAGTELARVGCRLLVDRHLGHGESAEPRGLGAARRSLELLELTAAAHTPAWEAPPGSRAGSRRRADLVRALAELDPTEPDWSLGLLARRLGLSERQTSRLFQLETGTSFRNYTVRSRVERAKKLLVSSDEPVTEVAYAAGWGSLSQFHTAFRRETGMTPGRFRHSYGSAAR